MIRMTGNSAYSIAFVSEQIHLYVEEGENIDDLLRNLELWDRCLHIQSNEFLLQLHALL